jgi:CHAD domain-containing protein
MCEHGNEIAERQLRVRAAVLKEQIDPLHREDVDAVHDMRVGSRRLRACLKYHAAAWDKKPRKAFFERAREVTRALGQARELDVCLGILEDIAQTEEGDVQGGAKVAAQRLGNMRSEQSDRVQRAAAYVESPDFAALMERVLETPRTERSCYVKKGKKQVKKAFNKVEKAYGKWRKNGSEDRLHRVRIAFKKFRYACELAAHLYEEDFQDLIGRSKQAQKDLGKWNDYRVLRNHVLQEVPPGETHALVEELERRMHDHYKDFREHAPAFFEGSSPDKIRERIKQPRLKCEDSCEAARVLREWDEAREAV